jgi:hypothetical protein
MDIHEWPRCIKSARRKKRLVKLDLDKQLIQAEQNAGALVATTAGFTHGTLSATLSTGMEEAFRFAGRHPAGT